MTMTILQFTQATWLSSLTNIAILGVGAGGTLLIIKDILRKVFRKKVYRTLGFDK